MRHKEKAIELVNKYINMYIDNPKFKNEYLQLAKESASLLVDEIIKAIEITISHCDLRPLDYQEVLCDIKYWYDVKTEIKIVSK
jgi:hypothetical protein